MGFLGSVLFVGDFGLDGWASILFGLAMLAGGSNLIDGYNLAIHHISSWDIRWVVEHTRIGPDGADAEGYAHLEAEYCPG